MADRQTLFDAVERLRAQREKRSQEMANFMQGLSGSGQIGFGIGRGLQRLFSDGQDPEMLQAQREEAYAKQVLMEQDPVKQAEMLQGAYALRAGLGEDLSSNIAATRAAMAEATLKRQEAAMARARFENEMIENAQKRLNPFEMPSEDDIAAATSMVGNIDWEAMNYGQPPNQMQILQMAGAMKAGQDPSMAILRAMGQPVSDRPMQDKYQDVRAKTDKQMQTTDVANPKSLSDPTEY